MLCSARKFVDELVSRRNARNAARIDLERADLNELPPRKTSDFEEERVRLTLSSAFDRGQRRLAQHLTEARLPPGKTLNAFEFDAVPMISKAQVQALAAGDAWLEKGGVSGEMVRGCVARKIRACGGIMPGAPRE